MLAGALGATDQRCYVENMLLFLGSPLGLYFALDPACGWSYDGGLALSIILTHLVSGISSEWACRDLEKPSFVSGRRRPSGKTGNLFVDPPFRIPLTCQVHPARCIG